MDFPFVVPGWEHVPLTLRTGSFFPVATIVHAGRPLEKVRGRTRTFALEQPDGSRLVRALRTRGLDWLAPQVVHEDRVVFAAPPLPPAYQALSFLPFVLVMAGGALGGVLALAARTGNLRLLRGTLPAPAKVILCLLVDLAAALVWFVLATLLRAALRH